MLHIVPSLSRSFEFRSSHALPSFYSFSHTCVYLQWLDLVELHFTRATRFWILSQMRTLAEATATIPIAIQFFRPPVKNAANLIKSCTSSAKTLYNIYIKCWYFFWISSRQFVTRFNYHPNTSDCFQNVCKGSDSCGRIRGSILLCVYFR